MIFIKYIYEFLVILFFLIFSTVLESILKSPIPATIISMLLLVLLLYLKIIKLKKIEQVSNFLLDNITLFMTPLIIGVVDKFNYFNGKFLQIFFILIVSVVISMIATAILTTYLVKIFVGDSKNANI